MEKFKENDRVRIWFEDSMEPNGGSWVIGTLKNIELTIKIPLTFIEDGLEINVDDYKTIRDIESFDYLPIDEFIQYGDKIEKINETK